MSSTPAKQKEPRLAKLAQRAMARAKGETRGQAKVTAYLKTLPPGGEVRVVFGNHWCKRDGWLVLKERHQDITKTLPFSDGSVDFIFTEHVVEHIKFCDALSFFRESLRVLKPGGILRVICPMLDRLLEADFSDPRMQDYFRQFYVPQLGDAEPRLRDIGLSTEMAPYVFMMNSVIGDFGHEFIWTGDLMAEVLRATGFKTAEKVPIGEGARPDCCIERRRRAEYFGHDWREDMAPGTVFDLESVVVEAQK